MSASPNIDELKKTIVEDVFSATGWKIDRDDPIVAAALVQAAFMATASNLAAKRIQAAADQFAERATRFEAAIEAAQPRHDRVQLDQRLNGMAADLRTLPGRLGMLACSIAGAAIGGGLVVGVVVFLNLVP